MRGPTVDLSAPEQGRVIVAECDCEPSIDGLVLHRAGCLVAVVEGLGYLTTLQVADRVAGARACRACGCTERYACPGGCSWIESDLCSVCVAIGVGPAGDGVESLR